MKYSFLFAVTMVFAVGAWAESTKTAMEAIETKAADVVHNGDVHLSRYNVDEFSIGAKITEIRDSWDSECKPEITIGRRANIEMLRNSDINEDETIADDLQVLHGEGRLETIISAVWDHESGDSEYCSINQFYVFTKDGYELFMDFNYTD